MSSSPMRDRGRSSEDERRGYRRRDRSVDDDDSNPGNQIYIRGLNYRTTESELRHIFEPYGRIEEIHIVKDPHLNECRGFAFVKFDNNEMAQRAIDKVDGTDFHGHRLIVELSKRARPRQKTPGEYLGNRLRTSRPRRSADHDRYYRDRSPYGRGGDRGERGDRGDRNRGGYDSYSGRDDRYRREDYREDRRDSYRERERERDREHRSERRYDDRYH